jgi:hypothetical protein
VAKRHFAVNYLWQTPVVVEGHADQGQAGM